MEEGQPTVNPPPNLLEYYLRLHSIFNCRYLKGFPKASSEVPKIDKRKTASGEARQKSREALLTFLP